MSEQLYSIIQKSDTEEYHIFETYYEDDLKCTIEDPKNKSICKKMEYQTGNKVFSKCENEKVTRINAAKIGRKVCGICISNFYTTY